MERMVDGACSNVKAICVGPDCFQDLERADELVVKLSGGASRLDVSPVEHDEHAWLVFGRVVRAAVGVGVGGIPSICDGNE